MSARVWLCVRAHVRVHVSIYLYDLRVRATQPSRKIDSRMIRGFLGPGEVDAEGSACRSSFWRPGLVGAAGRPRGHGTCADQGSAPGRPLHTCRPQSPRGSDSVRLRCVGPPFLRCRLAAGRGGRSGVQRQQPGSGRPGPRCWRDPQNQAGGRASLLPTTPLTPPLDPIGYPRDPRRVPCSPEWVAVYSHGVCLPSGSGPVGTRVGWPHLMPHAGFGWWRWPLCTESPPHGSESQMEPLPGA